MEYLTGGRVGQIARIGETIVRPAGEWTPTIHRLLAHIREEGFLAAPKPLGFDGVKNEIVSFLPGEVSNYPLSESAMSAEALVSAAQLLRAYHDASASFIDKLQGNEIWMLTPREPADVICHGDYAPYNVVLQGNLAVGIIDFDTAHPAPRAWDIAYALYRWAPLTHPNNPDGFGSKQETSYAYGTPRMNENLGARSARPHKADKLSALPFTREKIARAQLFCDAYGLPAADRVGLVSVVIERLQTLVDFMHAEADHGNEAFKANIADGHHLIYLKDIEYLKSHGKEL